MEVMSMVMAEGTTPQATTGSFSPIKTLHLTLSLSRRPWLCGVCYGATQYLKSGTTRTSVNINDVCLTKGSMVLTFWFESSAQTVPSLRRYPHPAKKSSPRTGRSVTRTGAHGSRPTTPNLLRASKQPQDRTLTKRVFDLAAAWRLPHSHWRAQCPSMGIMLEASI